MVYTKNSHETITKVSNSLRFVMAKVRDQQHSRDV